MRTAAVPWEISATKALRFMLLSYERSIAGVAASCVAAEGAAAAATWGCFNTCCFLAAAERGGGLPIGTKANDSGIYTVRHGSGSVSDVKQNVQSIRASAQTIEKTFFGNSLPPSYLLGSRVRSRAAPNF